MPAPPVAVTGITEVTVLLIVSDTGLTATCNNNGSGGLIARLNVVLVVCGPNIPLSVIVTVYVVSGSVIVGVPLTNPVAVLKDIPLTDEFNTGSTE